MKLIWIFLGLAILAGFVIIRWKRQPPLFISNKDWERKEDQRILEWERELDEFYAAGG